MSEQYQHIGLVAVGPRNIRSGAEYNKLFLTPDFERTVLKSDGTIDETVFLMGSYIKKYHSDTAKIAQMLKGTTLQDTCRNVWNFVYQHIQYKLDKQGEEQLRRPALLWAMRHSGGDCDCMTIFVCSILYNLKIPFKIRITKYDGKSYFQHVYPIVPYNISGYYTIDCVVSQFDYEKPFSTHKDFSMTTLGIPIVGLHGISSDIDTLVQGLGEANSTEQAVYDHLVRTREIITANPGIISNIEHEPSFLEMLDYAIQHFWHPSREEAFKHLAWNEAMLNKHIGVEEDDMIREDDDDEEENADSLLGIDDLDGIVDGDDHYDFDGLGRSRSSRNERKAKRKFQKAEKKLRKAAKAKNPRKAARKLRKAEKKIAKGFFRKTGVVLANKADKSAILKHNPILISQQQEPYESAEETIDTENVSTDNSPEASDSNAPTERDYPTEETASTEELDDTNAEATPSSDESDEILDSAVDDETISGLLGLGAVPKGNEQQIYRHLIATRDIIQRHPDLIPLEIDYTPGFLDMLNYAIKHFWTPNQEEAMKVLAINEARLNKVNGLDEDDLLGIDEDGIEGIVDYDNHYEFDGLGQLGGKEKRKQIRAERKAERKATKDANKKERKNAKGFFRKIGVALKQGNQNFKKINPAMMAMRNSFLLIMKINLFGLAAKAKWGYATPEQAKKAGISDETYKKSKKFISQLEKLFVNKAGGSKVSLKRNILTSKKAQLGSIVDLSGPEAAPVLAALPLVTAVLKLLVDNGLMSKKEADDLSQKAKDKNLTLSDDDTKELDNIQKEEDKNDNSSSNDGGDSSSGDSSDSKGFFSSILDKAKEHPIIAVSGLLLCSYMFIPPIKHFVNGILKIGKPSNSLQGIPKEYEEPEAQENTLEGTLHQKALPEPKPKSKATAKRQHLEFITLK